MATAKLEVRLFDGGRRLWTDATGVFPCIDSGPLNPESTFSLHITRPNPRQLLHYYVQDGTGNAPTMVGYVTVK